MPRPKKCKKVSCLPIIKGFKPIGTPMKEILDSLTMTVEEYETIRLIDFKGFTQQECAEQMGVSRTTITAIYMQARKKISEAIVLGKVLIIEGGDFIFYEKQEKNKKVCKYLKIRRDEKMKIAVTYENGNVFGHFGHTEEFKIFTTEKNNIVSSEIISTNGEGHGNLARFLKKNNVEILICGGIGGGAKIALSEQNIKFYPGVTGSADEAVQNLLNNNLKFNFNEECNHHEKGNHHHEEEHKCSCRK